MLTNEKISIVVPIYNVENYLEKCVNSLINQTYQNLEIILVDDGSPDNSGKLADELAKKDERIVVYHKANGGLSDARNYGVEKANGAYIGFVDSDDYIHEQMYEYLYQAIQTQAVDVAECNFTFVYDNHTRKMTEEVYALKLDKAGYLKEYLAMRKLYGATCTRLIKSTIAKKIYFPKGKIYEDMYYALDLIKHTDSFFISDKPYYYYLMRNNSITNETFNARQLALIDVVEEFASYTKKNYTSLSAYADNRLFYAYFGIFNQIMMLNDYQKNEYYHQLYQYLMKNFMNLMKNPVISNNRKLSLILIRINVKLYKKVLRKYMKGLRTI